MAWEPTNRVELASRRFGKCSSHSETIWGLKSLRAPSACHALSACKHRSTRHHSRFPRERGSHLSETTYSFRLRSLLVAFLCCMPLTVVGAEHAGGLLVHRSLKALFPTPMT
eukprot:3422036-Pleurochrysis_carterae.AAC.2